MKLFQLLRRKSDLAEEIESHLRMATADREGRGESPVDARTSAIRELGNVPLIADVTRDQWGWLRLELFMQDASYGLRMLAKNPGFTAVAVLSLALGIGINTAVFSIVNGVLLNPMPFPHPDQLVDLPGDSSGSIARRSANGAGPDYKSRAGKPVGHDAGVGTRALARIGKYTA